MTDNRTKELKDQFKIVKKLFPSSKVPWLESTEAKLYVGNEEVAGDAQSLISNYTNQYSWKWPKKKIFFFCDLHGDAEAFLNSLLATGVVKLKKERLSLMPEAKEARFVIGGDLFDKGPSNLDLLDLLGELRKAGAQIDLLAGNHDIRTFVGIHFMGHKSLKTKHLFTRVGGKSLTLFKEIYERYGNKNELPKCPHSEEELIELMFPDKEWFKEFPIFAKEIIHPAKLEKECKRIEEKVQEIQEMTVKLSMKLTDIWSCVMKARELFLEKKGQYHWIFNELELAKKYGSFIFVHGGLDDDILPMIFEKKSKDLKRWFHAKLQEDAFDLYHGSIGNCFRTKYREYDYELSEVGTKLLHSQGVHAIVHGHLNQSRGQRLVLRGDMLHFQCDCSLDQNTRKKEGIPKQGMAVTIFHPSGRCEAISSDYDKIKVFKTSSPSTVSSTKSAVESGGENTGLLKGKLMSKSKKLKFDHESIEDTESIIKYFEAISEGFKSGGLKFGNGKKTINLSPNGILKLKINVGKNDDKVKLSMNLEWKEAKGKNKKSVLSIETDNESTTSESQPKDQKD